ncbi:uncharacterized protein FA14DRAFT_53909 [Meira miltonrushii]|uniref:Pentatricopeptide repeat-containing protein-mitochondrial domain-containing protein n=1 Tax=Meira miltonrushii TaxID=1280837 RepID=A0A316VL79_9BASI|nr:uncharacterized protein FA14DRAFT_53909 [Meira miltonrushii]PWN36295.1 hypothetical protein FA14DRAFT_53909 [Meira miltonrushii]
MATRAIWLGSARVASLASSAARHNAVRMSSMNAVSRVQGRDYNNIHTTAAARNDGMLKQDPVTESTTENSSAQQDQSTASSSKQTLDTKPKSKRIRRGGGTPLFVARNPSSATTSVGNLSKQKRYLERQAFDYLNENEKVFKDDDVMRTLMLKLGKQVKRLDLVGSINTCAGIRDRMLHVERQTKRKASLTPPTYIFHQLLTVLGSYGDLPRCKEILDEMRACGKEIGITELELVLRAAAFSGGADEVDDILSDLVKLLNDRGEPGKEGKDDLSQTQADDQILQADFMRNWTPKMYRTMFLQCQMSRNLEYGLTLLGAAGRRSKEEEEKDPTRQHLFLHEILDLTTIKAILNLARDCRHARLMSDLALWFDEGASKRTLGYDIWMEVLRCCAEEHWFPGVELAWERSIRRGLFRPDEGLFMSILHCASRASQPKFIEDILMAMKGFGQVRNEMREWHLMPLFDAQCSKSDFEGALRTATKIAKLAHVASTKNHLLALSNPFESSKTLARTAYKAFVTVGRDGSEDGGVITHSMNAMIRLARKTGLHEMALKIYGVRKYLADGLKVSEAALPKLPTFYLELGMNADMVGEPGKEIIRQTITQIQDMDTVHEQEISANKRIIQPDIATFNALLGTAIDTDSRELAEFVFRELNAYKIKADETTYERAIVLYVAQENYSDAYAFLQECQSKMIPSKASFLAVALRCLREDDDRWINIGQEMVKNGYFPGGELLNALIKGGHISAARLGELSRSRERTKDRESDEDDYAE